ncbi:hypothetical protein EPI10_000865 [Gossypium australe]|uniref:Uncharacterized protein n=1 Tax=Gossypium australe TaxID=47621 RepID=A0A5B6V9G9_9ROSI|nr:hypothetical protein EPI10_000865 [Gossypium australe]
MKQDRKCKASRLSSRLDELNVGDPDKENLVELVEIKLALNLEVDKDESSVQEKTGYILETEIHLIFIALRLFKKEKTRSGDCEIGIENGLVKNKG